MYKSYGLLRALSVFAGIIGILQSLLWIAISILAILSYHCIFNFRGVHASLATITEITMFQMYFHGPCYQSGMPNIDYMPINRLNLIKPMQIHFCMWIYCCVSALWLISSITLITSVRYTNLKNANCFLNIWILLTFGLSIMDLCLGIAFGIDYDTLRHEAHRIAVNDYGGTDQPQYLIFSAKSVATIMMGITFRGYTIWVINVVLCIYFFTQTFKITDYNRIKKTISNASFVSTNGTMSKKPLPHQNSFGEKNDQWIESLHTYGHQMNPVNNSPTEIHRQNQAAALFEERKRHYEAQQLNYLRYINRAHGRKSRSTTRTGHTTSNSQSPSKKRRDVSMPEPDYSPSVQRIESFNAKMPLRSALKSSRY